MHAYHGSGIPRHTESYMRLVLLGPPGSGRRFLAKTLARQFGITYINLHDLLGEMAKEETELARLIGELLAACAPIPEELVASALAPALNEASAAKGFIIDDYPRDVSHAETLDRILRHHNMVVDAVIALNVDADDLMERLVGKLTCDDCGTDYNIYSNPPLVDGVCDVCGGRVARRPGDYEETISNRLRVYDGHVIQLLERYRALEMLTEFNGIGDDPAILAKCVRAIKAAPRRELEPESEQTVAAESAARKKARRAAAKKGRARKTRSKKAAPKKAAPKKAAPKKAAPKKAAPKKAAPRKAAPRKAAPRKAAPKKAAPKKAAPKKAAPKKAAPKKAAPKKAAPRKAAPRKAAPKKAAPKKAAPKKAAPRKAAPKKAAPKKVAKKKPGAMKKARAFTPFSRPSPRCRFVLA